MNDTIIIKLLEAFVVVLLVYSAVATYFVVKLEKEARENALWRSKMRRYIKRQAG